MLRYYLTLLLAGMSFSDSVSAQVHKHGHGQAFIAQENNQWVIELIMPAADILGFEHAAETKQQKETLSRFQDTVQTPENFVKLPVHCKPVSVNISLPSDENGEHRHSELDHSNVELSFEYRCQSTIESISFPILKTYGSLASLSVEWITENGQGAQNITLAKPGIRF